MWLARRRYQARLAFFRRNVSVGSAYSYDLDDVTGSGPIRIQGFTLPAAIIVPLCPQVGAVIKIQAFFRANKAREEYRMLGESAYQFSPDWLILSGSEIRKDQSREIFNKHF